MLECLVSKVGKVAVQVVHIARAASNIRFCWGERSDCRARWTTAPLEASMSRQTKLNKNLNLDIGLKDFIMNSMN